MPLTQKQIDGFVYEGAVTRPFDVRWDDAIRGFGVRVWPSGKKTFVVRYYFEGRRRYLTLGDVSVLTLHQARDQARLRLADVIGGIDPLEEKRRRAFGETVGEIADKYLERKSLPDKRSYKSDVQKVRDYIKPALGQMKLKALTKVDLVRLRDKIGYDMPKVVAELKAAGGKVRHGGRQAKLHGGRTCANRVLALVSSIWSWAKEQGLTEEGAENPVAGVERYKEVARDRYVGEDEMPRLAEAINAEPNAFIRGLFWLYLMTGMRRSELAKLTWSQVDLPRGRLHVGQTKSGRPLYLPLTLAAVKILEGLPKYDDNPHVFCSRKEGRPLAGGIDGAWLRIRKKAGMDDVRIHDLRHTLASWLVNSGVSLPMIGRMLNHSSTRTTQRYAHLQLDPVAKELEGHSRRLLENVGAAAPVTIDVTPSPPSDPSAPSGGEKTSA